MNKPASNAPNKNRFLVLFRKWHSWGGLFLSVFILTVAVTGLLLNHKDFFLHGEEKKREPSGNLSTTTDFAKTPVSFDQALSIARGHYGDVPLEKIELKDEAGTLIYKVARGEGQEIRIDATTGALSSKYGIALASAGGKVATGESRLNWAKIVDDLHTGKLFGGIGIFFVDATSIVLVALTLTGIYLWGVPLLRKRQSQKRREADASVATATPEAAKREPDPEAIEARRKKTEAILAAARAKKVAVVATGE